MLLDVVVPEVSDGVTTGTVISVAVSPGDTVAEDQTLVELETDKAVVAIPSPAGGTIADIKVAEGDSVAVGAVIVQLKTDDAAAPISEDAGIEETPPAAGEDVPEQPQQQKTVDDTPETVEASDMPVEKPVDLTPVRRGGAVAPAAPSVRRIARELGVDIHAVRGTGPGGRISEDDVRAYVRERMRAPDMASGSAFGPAVMSKPLPDFTRWGTVSRQPLSRIRQVTAEAMATAWGTIPMVTQYDKVDVTEMEAFRQKYNEEADSDGRLTLTAILVKVCAAALKKFPQFNSSLDATAQELILKEYVHIGVAVDTQNGLLVPVIRDADQKGVEQLATELNALAARTRERKVAPDELEGGTFTISNLGGIGGTAFTPIVYAPQVAILGVSRAEILPVWDGQSFAPRQIVMLSLSYDHRVIDGADGARFIRWISSAIENPIKLLI